MGGKRDTRLGINKGSPAAILDRDLVLTPDYGAARITQEEFGNTYGRVGGAYCYFKP